MSILETPSGPIRVNWSVADADARAPKGFRFSIDAPYNDGLPGSATLGFFAYRPHAELAARAPAMAEAMSEFCDRVEAGEVRSRRTYAKFCEILGREPRP